MTFFVVVLIRSLVQSRWTVPHRWFEIFCLCERNEISDKRCERLFQLFC